MEALRKSFDRKGPYADPPELLREADADMVARLLRGIVPLQPPPSSAWGCVSPSAGSANGFMPSGRNFAKPHLAPR